jgi:hypothetical protein
LREATHTEGRAVGAHAVIRQLDALLHDLLSLFLLRRLTSKAGKEGEGERERGREGERERWKETRGEEREGQSCVFRRPERPLGGETGRFWAA